MSNSLVTPRLVLASTSPRRKELLEEEGYRFRIVSSPAEELHDASIPLDELCEQNAELKAAAVAVHHPDAVVLGADTLVWIDGEPLGKPKSMDEARAMLRCLSGHAHTVCTGVCLIGPQGTSRFHVNTEVVFRTLSDEEIDAYFALVNPLDKAGSYAVQEHGERVVAEVRGDFTNVIGLPVIRVAEELAKFGIQRGEVS